MSDKPKGIIVEVYKSARGGDCTLNGVTSRFKEFVLVDPAIDGVFEATDEMPALYIERRVIGGKEYVSAKPSLTSGKWYMFGGNFVFTSDSRVRRICEYPIPVHDRCEG